MKATCLMTLLLLCVHGIAEDQNRSDESPTPSTTPAPSFVSKPIGHVEQKDNGETFIHIEDQNEEGLLGLEDWSHIWVIYWFDRNDNPRQRSILQVHPRGNPDNPLTGVFATRSPVRPNLIGLSLCRVLSVEGSTLQIEKIDAFDQTHVLDIKPYARGIDRPGTEISAPPWTRGQRQDDSTESQ